MPVRSKWQSLPTEAINPATLAIDKLSAADIVEGMLNEDRKMLAAVQREKDRIAVGVEIITQALRKGGRIIFVGAGTSGRLGVLESAEMPPTFGTSPELVQAIMAGGKDAILRAAEGVEDNYEEGARSVNRLRPTKKDVVIGVSASGMTQFVRGALTRARKAGSKIIFVTCDPRTELQTFVDLTIAPAVGPEVIAGSTRLKAGTATKMVLNMLTTASMIRIGKTYGNLMVDVQIGSEKLKDRARRIITIVTGLEYDEADKLLRRAHWNVKAAIVMQKGGLTYAQSLSRLRRAHDFVRDAIGEDVEPRLKELLTSRVVQLAAAPIQPDLRAAVQLQERRRQPRRHRSLDHPLDAARLGRAGREQHDPPGVENRRHPHRQRLARHARSTRLSNSAALARRVAGFRRVQCVRATSARAGSLKPMWPFMPESEDLQVDAAGALDRALVAAAFAIDVARSRRSGTESAAAAG